MSSELYALDYSDWHNNVVNILGILGCCANRYDYSGSSNGQMTMQEFLYDYIGISKYLTADEKTLITNIDKITNLDLGKEYNGIECYAVKVNVGKKEQNEIIAEIAKYFYYAICRKCILCFLNDGNMAFTGVNIKPDTSCIEVVISEWFYSDMSDDLYDALLEVDFNTFCSRSRMQFYSDYIYSIARKYIRYPESKMYLTYGCESVFIYREEDCDEDNLRIDRDRTFQVNKSYYPEKYGIDYFFDDKADKIIDFAVQEDDIRWTLLEMEIDALDFTDEYELNTQIDEEDEDESNKLNQEDTLQFSNPEVMLEWIRNVKIQN